GELSPLGLQERREERGIARLRSTSCIDARPTPEQAEDDCGWCSGRVRSMKKISLVVFALAFPLALTAQQPTPDTTKPAPPPPPPPATVSVPVDFSGVLYANFQYRGDEGTAKSTNKFDLERAYLTFRMPAGDRASIRITD